MGVSRAFGLGVVAATVLLTSCAEAATTAAQDKRLRILVAEPVPNQSLEEPYAHFVYLVHQDGSEAGLTRTEPVDACHDVRFGFYGATAAPARIPCPATRTPVTTIPGPETTPEGVGGLGPVNPTAGG